MMHQPVSNPFPGLRPFEPKEGYLFFGRAGQGEELLKRLLRVRLLAVVGTSGSGKSSLVRAALIPYLTTLPGSEWKVATFRPAGDPIASVTEALNCPDVIGKAAASPEDAARDKSLLGARLRRSGLGLIEVIRLARLPEGQKILIVVDQFEELFRFVDFPNNREGGAAFVKLLLEAARQTELPIYIVLTMRSDFIGDCSQFHDLPEAVAAGLYLIPRMTRDERRAAIEEPVRIAGGSISRRLVNRLLNDAGDDPDQLPIMQHALMRTWDDWQKSDPGSDQPIDLQNYEEVGGMTEALPKHADQAFNDLDDYGKNIARRMFQCLTEKEADNRKIRRATDVATLAKVVGVTLPELTAVIEDFRKPGRSFLMPLPPTLLAEDTRIDISHESLIRRWNRLAGWVEEEAESATIYRRIEQTAVLHAQRKAGLWGDPDLADSLAWKERIKPTEAWAERYGGHFKTSTDFIEESRIARDAALLRRRRFWQSVVAAAVLVIVGLSAVTTWALIENASAQRATRAANQATIAANQATADASQVATLSRQQLSERDAAYLDKVGDLLTWAPPVWSAYLHRAKAEALERTGDFSKARTEVDFARKADPNYLPTLVTSSDLFVIAGDGEGAVRDAEEYLQVVKTNTVAYGNLVLGEAMRRNYSEAIAAIDEAVRNAGAVISDVESLVAPDVQDLTHGFKLSVPSTDFVLALRYTKPFLYAMAGNQRFQAALDEADQSDRDYPYSRNAYLAALNWQWLIVRGQGFHDMQSAPSGGGGVSMPQEIADYGAYAIEGALWARVARTRTDFAERSQNAYHKFLAAYGSNPQNRYQSLVVWVERELRRHPEEPQPEPVLDCPSAGARLPVVDCARALAEQADELKAPAGSHPINFVAAFSQLSEAIDLLIPQPGSPPGRRQQDLLIDLLLRRGDWRLEGDAGEQDKGGAAQDARAALALNSNVAGAYRLLAAAAFDDDARKTNYEQTLDLDPFNSAALQSLANLIQNEDPKCALALLQKRLRIASSWSSDYLQIARLEKAPSALGGAKQCPANTSSARIPDYAQALRHIDTAIKFAPWKIDLYAERRDIETKKGGIDQARIDLHFAQGLRAAAEYYVRTGDHGQGLRRYLLAFVQASHLPTINDDVQFELDTVIRNLSAFISDNYGRAEAEQFWRALAQDPLLDSSQRQIAASEASRLSQQP